MKRLALLFAALCLSGAVLAKDARPLAEDEAVEQRMIAISEELRCLVCQNESLAGSHAELAEDLRREIRTMIKAGKTDAEIMDFLVQRYGDFVRYRPPLKATTLLLWGGPFVLLLGGIAGLLIYLRQRNAAVEQPLDEAERRKAEALIADAEKRNVTE
ncbi:cytochrome c-type biogenesis protein CcmH [Niveibacterium umoris]|uniref:Cytochrome c-type biogenesis protein n=1 Tax=Niveibacterium umoris TaxID=1193620 RepID=A0A840BH33_9RHOO|nr:cytochrome c-type biogenesis protein [Niveibacterium umoris]MBB4010929.1 cytochrome c-type biogenesis protein CcmH [Niveibacterium umoris]